MLRSMWYKWKHRNDSLEQSKTELKKIHDAIREEYKNEPATKELHEVLESFDELEKEFGL